MQHHGNPIERVRERLQRQVHALAAAREAASAAGAPLAAPARPAALARRPWWQRVPRHELGLIGVAGLLLLGATGFITREYLHYNPTALSFLHTPDPQSMMVNGLRPTPELPPGFAMAAPLAPPPGPPALASVPAGLPPAAASHGALPDSPEAELLRAMPALAVPGAEPAR